MNSIYLGISVASVQGCGRSVSGFRFSITPILHTYVKQSRVTESTLLGAILKPQASLMVAGCLAGTINSLATFLIKKVRLIHIHPETVCGIDGDIKSALIGDDQFMSI